MNTFAYPIFQMISSAILFGYATIVDAAAARFGHAITQIVVSIETVYIMHYGYMIIFRKSSEAVPNPSVKDLLYHLIIVVIVLYYSTVDINTPLEVIKSLRRMVIDGLTGDLQTGPNEWPIGSLILDPVLPDGTEPAEFSSIASSAAEKVMKEIGVIYASFAAYNLFTVAPVMKDVSAPLQTTTFIMSLVSDVAPQITAGIILLINELMVRTGLALFPLVLYCLLYKVTKNFFFSWFNMMFAASIQIAVLIVTISICAKVTVMFVTALTALSVGDAGLSALNTTVTALTKNSSKIGEVGQYVISSFQESVIQAGFGITLTALMAWVPANSANFAGTLLMAGTTKSGVGMAMTARGTTPHQPYMKATAQAVGNFFIKTGKSLANKLTIKV